MDGKSCSDVVILNTFEPGRNGYGPVGLVTVYRGWITWVGEKMRKDLRLSQSSGVSTRPVFWLAVLLVLLLLAVAACGKEERRLQLGDPAPDFSASDQHGNIVRLADLAGGPVVLRFWSVDCKFCRADTPVFNDYYRRYQDQGLTVIYISLNEDREMVRRFIADLEIEFPVLIDHGGRIAEQYRIKLDPQAIFIDPEHRLAAAVLGGVGEEEMARLLGGYLE